MCSVRFLVWVARPLGSILDDLPVGVLADDLAVVERERLRVVPADLGHPRGSRPGGWQVAVLDEAAMVLWVTSSDFSSINNSLLGLEALEHVLLGAAELEHSVRVVRQELLFHKKLVLSRVRAIPACNHIQDIVFRSG